MHTLTEKVTKSSEQPASRIVLEIGRDTYLLPPGKNIAQVLDALSGLREVRMETFFYLTGEWSSDGVMEDRGETEFAVKSVRRRMVTAAEFRELQRLDREGRTAREEKEKVGAK